MPHIFLALSWLAASLVFPQPAQQPKKVCGCDVSPGDSEVSTYPSVKPCKNRAPYNYGILDRLVIERPKAEYPREAEAAGASGTVVVYVDVDEKGNVRRAVACTGHPALRKAAVDAAYKAKLRPPALEGKTFKIEGVITYKFGAGKRD